MARPSAPPTKALQAWWQQRPPREQALMLAAVWLVGLTLLWSLLLAPAWRSLRSFDTRYLALEQQHQRMLQLQAQAKSLQAMPALEPAAAQQALQSSLRNSLGAQASMQVQGNIATVTLQGVRPEALAQWLARTRSTARLTPFEAKLQRGPQGWSGSLRIRLGPA
jgi:general secretion pathway protein M